MTFGYLATAPVLGMSLDKMPDLGTKRLPQELSEEGLKGAVRQGLGFGVWGLGFRV